MYIGRDEFLDGGAGNNNPSNIAWREAKLMSNQADQYAGKVGALVSLGCGERERIGLFGNQKNPFYIIKALRHGKYKITDTEGPHMETAALADESGSPYFRFSVRPVEGDRGYDGLSGVKLSECKRQPRSGGREWVRDAARNVIASATRSSSWSAAHPPARVPVPRPDWYASLLSDARTGKFDPDRYKYTTYDKIFDRTQEYYTSVTERRMSFRRSTPAPTCFCGTPELARSPTRRGGSALLVTHTLTTSILYSQSGGGGPMAARQDGCGYSLGPDRRINI